MAPSGAFYSLVERCAIQRMTGFYFSYVMSTYVQYLLHTELTTFTMPACLLGAPAKFGLNRVTPHMCVPVAYWSSLVHVDAQPTSMIIDGTKASPPATAAAASRGAFILLEGVDRCGKTTQCALLLKHLLSLSMAAVALRFPDRTTQVGKLIDGYLQSGADLDDRAVHLLFSANRWEAAPSLAQTLAQTQHRPNVFGGVGTVSQTRAMRRFGKGSTTRW